MDEQTMTPNDKKQSLSKWDNIKSMKPFEIILKYQNICHQMKSFQCNK